MPAIPPDPPPIGSEVEVAYPPDPTTTDWRGLFWTVWRYEVVGHWVDQAGRLQPILTPLDCRYFDGEPGQGGREVDPDDTMEREVGDGQN